MAQARVKKPQITGVASCERMSQVGSQTVVASSVNSKLVGICGVYKKLSVNFTSYVNGVVYRTNRRCEGLNRKSTSVQCNSVLLSKCTAITITTEIALIAARTSST